jgi:UDP-glucose 4-epimerase
MDIIDGLAPYAQGTFEPEFAPARPGEMDRSCLDIARAREVLGWTPTVGLAEGLRRTVSWATTTG